MIVVIPILGPSEHYLQKAVELTPKPAPFHCLLISDSDVSSDVQTLVNGMFTTTETQILGPLRFNSTYQKRENRLWQKVARDMAKGDKPWFWWSPGALPLRRGWIDKLHTEYKTHGKPFLGIGANRNGSRYLDSLAIYPPNTMHYSDGAMLVMEEPFNRVAGKSFFQAAHFSNLIAHDAPSLAEAVITIPLPESVNIEKYLKADPLVSEKPAENPIDAIYANEEQALPVPGIRQQTEWECGFYRFPDEGHAKGYLIEYFNPTICFWKNRWRLITRRRSEQTRPAKNTLMMWTLVDNTPVDPRPIYIPPRYQGEHWEDPRASMLASGHVLLSWCNFNHRAHAHQAYGTLSDQLSVTPKHLAYGRNGDKLISNRGPEKNWGWFEHEGQIWCSYLLCPNHEIIRVKDNRVVERYMTPSVDIQKLWRWGEIRGGAPPYRVGDYYYCWMHSRLPWCLQRGYWYNRYYMGVVEFEAKPPFRLTRVSEKPILTGSEFDPINPGAPLCIFPCGSALVNDAWHVVAGCNDCRCIWLRAPHDELEETLVSV